MRVVRLTRDAVWQVCRRACVSGSIASLSSALALARGGERDLGNPLTPLNGPSQWVLGRGAPHADGATLPHTPLGFAIHHGSSIFWALFFEAARPSPPRQTLVADCVVPAAVTAGAAAFVDLVVTPPRFRPGFERRLSAGSLVYVYAAFALGLAGARLLARQRAARDDRRA